ncbi:hypothetical protein DFQ01_105143 [Paenibacillus cellulosilyticus]|uniref:Polyprenyl synthetase n=1 Tax=Paenibacillus cellulosilyticus TaxID=375489 RepID=A0A2V2YVN4_9BACL|nr:hypothetical protein [Paenibacillus cellulosilyticus]PWW05159.1 hypothetical protein DFQ01_105143 [Paenibacillus cellulosilyticus]QKS48698.1 hypothetical protein HUB94_31380 [Paenibacillus cellulosilyticus]
MREVDDFKDEIAYIFEEASRELEELPVELREMGLAFLKRCNPLNSGGQAKSISFLLPYWLKEETGAPIALCRDLSIGSVYVMLQYFILDDVMDGGDGRLQSAGIRRSLALAQMLSVLVRKRYSRYFAQDSLIWSYERRYVEQWSSAVTSEALESVDPRDCRQLAGKAAPIKLGAAGVLLWSGQTEQRIAEVEEAIDLALAVLQLSDDYADWLEDMQEESRNSFLTIVKEELAGEADGPLDEQAVKRAIYRRGAVIQLAEIAEAYGERMEQVNQAPQRLKTYQRAIVVNLRESATNVVQAVEGLATQGGFSQLLSNFRKI